DTLRWVESCVAFFFFSSRRRHTSSKRDWSSDVCSSDLLARGHVHRDRSEVDMTPREILIEVDLGAGDATGDIWTNDLTHDYVEEIGRASCRERAESTVCAEAVRTKSGTGTAHEAERTK